MWYFPKSVDNLNLVNLVYGRAKASMYTENSVVDHHAEREIIKHVGKILPYSRRSIFSSTFKVKAVSLTLLAMNPESDQNGSEHQISVLSCSPSGGFLI